jgi:hypothetical protein
MSSVVYSSTTTWPSGAITEDDTALSGSVVAIALIENFSPDIPILIHSTNQVQVPRVVRQLEQAGFCVTRIPYYHMSKEAFLAWLMEAHEIWEEFG